MKPPSLLRCALLALTSIALGTCLLLSSGCSGFVQGVRDAYTKPAGPTPPRNRQNHYDANGRWAGHSEDRGTRRMHYDTQGRYIGYSEIRGERQHHYDAQGRLKGSSTAPKP